MDARGTWDGQGPLNGVLAMMFNGAGDFDFKGIFPALYGNGKIGNESAKKKKALSDADDQETILKERWAAAKFVQHQLRIVVDQYDPAEEPTDGNDDTSDTTSSGGSSISVFSANAVRAPQLTSAHNRQRVKTNIAWP